MYDDAGFSMLNQPLALYCRRDNCALRDARRFASLTSLGLGSNPCGLVADLSFFTLAQRSLRLALLNVLQGGAKWSHLTFCRLISFLISLKLELLSKSNDLT